MLLFFIESGIISAQPVSHFFMFSFFYKFLYSHNSGKEVILTVIPELGLCAWYLIVFRHRHMFDNSASTQYLLISAFDSWSVTISYGSVGLNLRFLVPWVPEYIKSLNIHNYLCLIKCNSHLINCVNNYSMIIILNVK